MGSYGLYNFFPKTIHFDDFVYFNDKTTEKVHAQLRTTWYD